MATPIRSNDSAIQSKPDEEIGGELVVPRKRGVHDITKKDAQGDHQHHEDEEEDGPSFHKINQALEKPLHRVLASCGVDQ
jgi:hypothetical protein